eukprot:Seg1738.9 transcript_id=Seg1738.9/GoldUCD/mRNA.D3Y31 product="RAB6-interacting golgin" protein_id=Seg1738.9/GoldUCD/D3Y31
MAGWSGFTDEELNRLKRETSEEESKKETPVAKVALGRGDRRGRPSNARVKARPIIADKGHTARKLTKNQKETDHNETKQQSESTMPKRQSGDEKNTAKVEVTKTQDRDLQGAETPKGASHEKEKKEKEIEFRILSDNDAAKIQMTELERLQKRQKEIEADNKIKKKIIKDTISQRYKKAQNEATTLQLVQKELAKLDLLLANDVEILRGKIEEATISYCHAQKRYERAEKEFVNSKLDLQLKRDTKEELTQHLYTIIQENELRKATKLEELISKLNVSGHAMEETSSLTEENVAKETLLDQNPQKPELQKEIVVTELEPEQKQEMVKEKALTKTELEQKPVMPNEKVVVKDSVQNKAAE